MSYEHIFTFKQYYKGMIRIETSLLTDSCFRWCDNAKTNNCLISQTIWIFLVDDTYKKSYLLNPHNALKGWKQNNPYKIKKHD